MKKAPLIIVGIAGAVILARTISFGTTDPVCDKARITPVYPQIVTATTTKDDLSATPVIKAFITCGGVDQEITTLQYDTLGKKDAIMPLKSTAQSL